MAQPLCDECQAILREFREVREMTKQGQPEGVSIREILAWHEHRLDDPDHRTRVRSALERVMQRLREHHKSTGHVVFPPVPRSSMINPN